VKNRLTIACSNSCRERIRAWSPLNNNAGVICNWIATDDPDELVLSGSADLAIHDAGDHARCLPEGLILAALVYSGGARCTKQSVVCRSDRADIRGRFFHLDARNAYGKVWLVGAGPGAADLITLRAQRVLARADIVYYDDLLDESLLTLCSGETFYVGKRKGCSSHTQDEINRKMYHSAVAGKTVVRLKGGDPSIFGRGGEELDYLLKRWVRVEIVPGVTSASAAAAAGLFSLTRRQVSRSAALLSAHGMKGRGPVDHTQGTFVYYMAASRLKEISHSLLAEGVPPGTPVVLVRRAGFWNEASVSTTVEAMPNLEMEPPVLLVAGKVTASARVEKKALFTGIDSGGIPIPEPIVHQRLIAAGSGSAQFSDSLESSLHETVDPRPEPLDLSFFSAVVFSSPSTVKAFEEIYGGFPEHLLCYTIGDMTREALLEKNIHPWRIVSLTVRAATISSLTLNSMKNAC
jgi:uroporphyrin-III C-methyltransferase